MRSAAGVVVIAVVATVLALVPSAATNANAAGGGACGLFETAIDGVPAVANPFDPAEIDVTVELSGPGGATLATPAFYTQDHTRALVGGFEHLTPVGTGHWLARATPTVAGTWQWRSVITTAASTTTSAWTSFECAPDPASHGVLRRSPADARYLRWEDGTPYLAVGENLGWYDGRGTYAYDDWLDSLAAHKATWIRIWMPSWAMGLEWLTRDGSGTIIESSLGNYTTRLDRAWQLDHVIEAARARGIVVMLTIQNHGAFSTNANSEWADNPYNATNGGPLTEPHQFFTDPTARALFERRLRYLVARWGYAPNLIWELWNEVDLTPSKPVSDVISWHAHMADVVRALDPYDHLMTTSLDGGQLADFISPNPVWPALWALPQMDIAQIHFYGNGLAGPIKMVQNIPNLLSKIAVHGKPVLLGEAGVDARGPAETFAADPDFDGLHELTWAGLFGGGAGTGMTWWWDNLIDPHDQYVQYDALNALIEGIALDEQHVATDGVTAKANGGVTLAAYPLRGSTATLVWIRNAKDWWHVPDTTTISGATITLPGMTLPAGKGLHVRWMDPRTGAFVDGGGFATFGDPIELTIPDFARETSLRLDVEDLPVVPTTTTMSTAPPPASTTTLVDGAVGAGTVIPAAPATPVTATPAFTG